jgi:CRISPR system Cascade subunit CasB
MNVPQTGHESSKVDRFVAHAIERCQNNKGLAARLRRADNPAMEYQSWELLARFGVDLEKEWERLPYATVTCAIAKAKVEKNGSLSLGRAIASCYEDGNDSDAAKARLRRLLACENMDELCRYLRPLLALVSSRVTQPLDYSALLKSLLRFYYDTQKIKAHWAQDFYGRQSDKETL